MLRLRLVGDLSLELDGRALEPPRSRRGRALLAWLALHPGMHPRRALAGRFWPDVLDQSARTSLRSALTELRQSLGDGAGTIAATRDSVGLLDGDELWVDVRDVDRLLAEGQLEQAVELGAGELLPGLDDEWVLEARQQHADRIAAALEELAERAERAGDPAEAVLRTRAAVALDPLAEDVHRRLIRRLALGGDRASALAAYEQLAERLRTELGIAPSASTRALVEEIRRGGSEAPILEVRAPAALSHPEETPFAGRDEDLARLRAAWQGVRQHEARRLLVVAGEPGVGKTRLALRFAREPQRDEAVVLVGRCSEEPLRPYEPFAEMLAQCVGATDALAALVDPAAATELERLLGGGTAEPHDDRGARHRLFDAVDAALAAVAGDRPLMLLVDDLQWAERPALLLLGSLLRSPRRTAVLVVATCREAEVRTGGPVAATLADLRRAGLLDRIALEGLDRGAVADLVGAWLGDEAARGETAEVVHARTGGNAFFVEEVLRSLADGDGDGVPETVRQSLAARLAALSAEAEALLATASVLGRRCDAGILERAAGLAPPASERALDELFAAHLLRPAAGTPGRVEFPHDLVREAVDVSLNPIRRARLHLRAADTLIETSEDAHLAQIAHHLFQAAAPDAVDRAVEYLRRAGERAVGSLAYEEGAGHFERALDLLADHGSPDDPRVGPLTIARGDALLRAGEAEGARSCFDAAAALARRRGDAQLLARAALGRTGLAVSIIAVDPERVALLEEALAAVGDRQPVLRSELLGRLAVELYYAPEGNRSEELSAEAVRVARAAGDTHAVAAALNARHVALWRPDRLEERMRTAEEMHAAARTAGDRQLELQALNWRVLDLFEAGDLSAWRAEVRRHGALADELRLPTFSWYTPLWEAVDALHAGRFDEGRALLDDARAAGERAGDPNAELFWQLLRYQEAIMRADYELADLDYARAKIAGSPAAISWRCGYAWLMAGLGRLDEAREHLAIVSADGYSAIPFDMNWPSAVVECAAACALLGEAMAGERLYGLLLPYAGRPSTAGRAIVTFGSFDRYLGGLALLLGRPDDAIGHLERAIEIDGGAGLRPWVTHARAKLAEALAQAGQPRRAAAEAERAAAEARELGVRLPAGAAAAA